MSSHYYKITVNNLSNFNITSVQTPYNQQISKVLVPGIQGPSGGAGVNFIQDSEPTSATNNQIWYNNLTNQIKIYYEESFKPIATDGGHF